ncbi:uncharacterized protein LOC132178112 [Corylus avellana]|uniref:uncharacterized protein LOC132178112 n=1 Tax=Corylus avellana TaxID=13451 RepID=UPI00286C22F3|nr:uncharacterized protein LOC132178112 [Corylus avellana]
MTKVNESQKEISSFTQEEDENFFESWERFKDPLIKCPHHGYEKWRLVQFFCQGLTQSNCSMIESINGGAFFSLTGYEVYNALDKLSDNSQQWDFSSCQDWSTCAPKKGGIYEIKEDTDLSIKIDALTKKVDALTVGQSINAANTFNVDNCSTYASPMQLAQNCPSMPAFAEYPMEQVNAFNNYRKQSNGPYSVTYNLGWRNHPIFFMEVEPTSESRRSPSSCSQSIPSRLSTGSYSLSLGPAKTITYLPSSHSSASVGLTVIEGNSKEFHEDDRPIHHSSGPTHGQEQVQSIVTLRSGRQVDNQVVLPKENPAVPQGQESGNKDKRDPEPSKATPAVEDPPRSFQVSSYAKFLKDLIIVKRKTNVPKKAFLTEPVSSILQCKLPIKYKDPRYPTISCMIGVSQIERALLDLGASMNLLPYSVYLPLRLGELKPTSRTLQLADKSRKVPRGIIKDALIKVDKFYFPVDFIVLGIEPISNVGIQMPVILGWPFLATANALINCRTGIMKISFGNMIVELNIFHIRKQPLEFDELRNVCSIEEIIEDAVEESSMEDPLEACLAQFGEDLDLDKLLEQAGAILENAPLVSNEKEEAAVPKPPKRNLSHYQILLSTSSSV